MGGEIENNTLYRFRSINGLLGEKYQELERQSIFFAPPKLLNDPAEGFRDIYFKGDEVLWENLFKHYLASLTNIVYDYCLFGESESLEGSVQTISPENTIPEKLKDSWEEIKNAFFNREELVALISHIVEWKPSTSQVELNFYLNLIHPIALSCVLEKFGELGFVSVDISAIVDAYKSRKSIGETMNAMREATEGEDDSIKMDFLLEYFQLQTQQFPLIYEYKSNILQPNKRLLTSGFPFSYIANLEQLMYPGWFTACFMSKATNSSVWGNYGDNHTGACLIFDAKLEDNRQHSITLNNALIGYGSNGPVKGTSSLPFHQIRYTHKQDGLNFFDSLGQLPIPAVNRQWLTNSNGKRSAYASTFNDEWRKKYWENYYLPITQKSKDWEYENEYRLVLNNMGGQYENHGVTLNYNFNSLKGIIFGINTSFEHKLKIIKIIEGKVRENSHYGFKFYQAYYCRRTGEIKNTELSMVRFSRS